MQKLFFLSLLLFASSIDAYSKEQAKRHIKVAAKVTAGSASSYFMATSVPRINQLMATGCLTTKEKEIVYSLLKLTVSSGILACAAFKSAYNDIKSN